jgi:hypothetical protein
MAQESQLQSKILNELRSFGKYCECFKIIKASDNGEPDIFFTTRLTGGVLLELKRLSGSPEKLQKIKIAKLNDCGTKTFVCHSWDEWCRIKTELDLNKPAIEDAHRLLINNPLL